MKYYLDSYIEALLRRGCYHFTREELRKQFDVDDAAIRQGLRRLTRNQRIRLIRNGFYVVIPPEHQNTGLLPPEMFIGEFMRHLNRPYYIGLLSAAALHGAGHQQPQICSIITTAPAIRPVLNIGFPIKSKMPKAGIEKKKTPAGYVNISSAELTALDLVTYIKRSGGISSVTAVLEELSENMLSGKLALSAKESVPATPLQRLGYILDEILNEQPLADVLWAELQTRSFFHIPLNRSNDKFNCPINKKWKIQINMNLEVEL